MQQRFEHRIGEIVKRPPEDDEEFDQAVSDIEELEADGWEIVSFDVQDRRIVYLAKRPYAAPEGKATPE